MPLPRQLEQAVWANMATEAVRLAHASAAYVKQAYDQYKEAHVWCDADRAVLFTHKPGENGPAVETPDRPWVLVKWADGAPFSPVATVAGWKPGLWPTAPNMATATLGSGLLGAGLGYGAGWLAEQILPEEYFQKGRLRRVGAAVGGVAGVAPPLWAGYRGWFKPRVTGDVPMPPGSSPFAPEIKAAADSLSRVVTEAERRLHPWYERYMGRMKLAFDEDGGLESGVAGTAGSMGLQSIPVDAFNQALWADPYTPPAYAAAATGVIQGASALRGGASWVSPLDVVRVGVHMGAGAVAGNLAGKVLGALAGLRPEAQKSLQQIGMWGGLVQSAVPLLFGSR